MWPPANTQPLFEAPAHFTQLNRSEPFDNFLADKHEAHYSLSVEQIACTSRKCPVKILDIFDIILQLGSEVRASKPKQWDEPEPSGLLLPGKIPHQWETGTGSRHVHLGGSNLGLSDSGQRPGARFLLKNSVSTHSRQRSPHQPRND